MPFIFVGRICVLRGGVPGKEVRPLSGMAIRKMSFFANILKISTLRQRPIRLITRFRSLIRCANGTKEPVCGFYSKRIELPIRISGHKSNVVCLAAVAFKGPVGLA